MADDLEVKSKRFAWATPALAVAAICGGLGGALFTWWVNHPRATTIAYTVTTTATVAEQHLQSLLPKFRIQLDGKDIPALYSHAVTFKRVAGPQRDEARLFVTVDSQATRYGYQAESPSPLHSFACSESRQGYACTAGPWSSQEPSTFRFSVATSSPVSPTFSVTDDLLSLHPLDLYLADQQSLRGNVYGVMLIVAGGLLAISVRLLTRRRMREWRKLRDKYDQELKAARGKGP